jgi:hypothetical protein
MYDVKWPSVSGPRSSILPPSSLEFPPREDPEQEVEASDDGLTQFPIADLNNCILQILIRRFALQISISRQCNHNLRKNIQYIS